MRTPDPRQLDERLEAISAGLKEAIRREVCRLRELGLPIYVERDGKVVTANAEQKHEAPRRPAADH